MNWEYVNRYAFETLGHVRTTPLPKDWSQAERDANTRAVPPQARGLAADAAKAAVSCLLALLCAAASAGASSTAWRKPSRRAGCECCERLRSAGRVILAKGIPAHVREWRETVRRHAEVCPCRNGGAR